MRVRALRSGHFDLVKIGALKVDRSANYVMVSVESHVEADETQKTGKNRSTSNSSG